MSTVNGTKVGFQKENIFKTNVSCKSKTAGLFNWGDMKRNKYFTVISLLSTVKQYSKTVFMQMFALKDK